MTDKMTTKDHCIWYAYHRHLYWSKDWTTRNKMHWKLPNK